MPELRLKMLRKIINGIEAVEKFLFKQTVTMNL